MDSRIVIALATALALDGCAVLTGGGGAPTPDGEPPQALTIAGALAYRERIALPPDSAAIVELREVSPVDGRVVAENRTPLNGRQVPIPFKLAADRTNLGRGARYEVRGTVASGGPLNSAPEPVQ